VTKLGEPVLDPVERPDRDEAADTRRRRLDVEREVLALAEPAEPAVGPVTDDRADARQIR
jgi:hypothetical protein